MIEASDRTIYCTRAVAWRSRRRWRRDIAARAPRGGRQHMAPSRGRRHIARAAPRPPADRLSRRRARRRHYDASSALF